MADLPGRGNRPEGGRGGATPGLRGSRHRVGRSLGLPRSLRRPHEPSAGATTRPRREDGAPALFDLAAPSPAMRPYPAVFRRRPLATVRPPGGEAPEPGFRSRFGSPVEHVDHPVVPAPLLGRLRPHLPGSRPDAQMAVGHQQLRHAEPPRPQIPQHRRPRLGGIGRRSASTFRAGVPRLRGVPGDGGGSGGGHWNSTFAGSGVDWIWTRVTIAEPFALGGSRLPEENVRRFRNRLRGLRDRWRRGTVTRAEVERRMRAWIAHAAHANTWRLRHAIFRAGWFDPALGLGHPPANVCCAAGPGTTNRGTSVRPTATGTRPGTGTTTTDSESPARTGGPKGRPGAPTSVQGWS